MINLTLNSPFPLLALGPLLPAAARRNLPPLDTGMASALSMVVIQVAAAAASPALSCPAHCKPQECQVAADPWRHQRGGKGGSLEISTFPGVASAHLLEPLTAGQGQLATGSGYAVSCFTDRPPSK